MEDRVAHQRHRMVGHGSDHAHSIRRGAGYQSQRRSVAQQGGSLLSAATDQQEEVPHPALGSETQANPCTIHARLTELRGLETRAYRHNGNVVLVLLVEYVRREE